MFTWLWDRRICGPVSDSHSFIRKKTKEALYPQRRRYGGEERKMYGENNSKQLPTTSHRLDDLVEFVDTHIIGEYWRDLPEADFEN